MERLGKAAFSSLQGRSAGPSARNYSRSIQRGGRHRDLPRSGIFEHPGLRAPACVRACVGERVHCVNPVAARPYQVISQRLDPARRHERRWPVNECPDVLDALISFRRLRVDAGQTGTREDPTSRKPSIKDESRRVHSIEESRDLAILESDSNHLDSESGIRRNTATTGPMRYPNGLDSFKWIFTSGRASTASNIWVSIEKLRNVRPRNMLESI